MKKPNITYDTAEMQAENGSGYLQASVSFYPMEAGILPEPL